MTHGASQVLSGCFEPRYGVRKAVRIKANAMPMIFDRGTAMLLGLSVPNETKPAERVAADNGFAGRLKKAATLYKERFARPDDVWNQLYTGGFFPAREDKHVLQTFHHASPEVKYELIQDLTDPRARELACWLMGSEWPEVLTPGDRTAIEDLFREHLMKEGALWATIPSALAQIAELLDDASPAQEAILEEYRAYLVNLRDHWIK